MKVTLVAEDEADVKIYLVEYKQALYYVNAFIYKNRDPFYLVRDNQGELVDDFALTSNLIDSIETEEDNTTNEIMEKIFPFRVAKK